MIFTSREIAHLRRLEILAGKVLKGQLRGEREFSRRGPGSGFREHRAYVPGDPIRMVDWNVFARMRELVIKEFDAEEALDVVLLHDRSASMRGAAALCAAKVVGALGAIALGHLDRVLWIPASGEHARPAESFTGRARVGDLLEALDGGAGGATDLLGAARQGLPRAIRGGTAFVISDFFDPAGATGVLSELLHRRYAVRVLQLEDSRRLDAPRPGRTRLVDAESGETLVLDISPATVRAYERAREARAQGLNAFCRHRGIGYLRLRADVAFQKIVRSIISRGWLTP